MRKKCPACESENIVSNWKMPFLIPDGSSLPKWNKILLCGDCSLIFYDNVCTQEDYDEYYKKFYGFDGNLDPKKQEPRLDEIIETVERLNLSRNIRICDFGGGNGYVANALRKLGYMDVYSIEVGQSLPYNVQLMIASHVFEHIYNLREITSKLIRHMVPHGQFLVEVPDASQYDESYLMPLLDYHQVHINHWTPFALDNFFHTFGYTSYYSVRKHMAYHDAPMYRSLYRVESLYYRSKHIVENRLALKLECLKRIKGPIIVWGCGSLAMTLLAKAPEQCAHVVHYVDRDPAYKGATIEGTPVLDHVEYTNIPIVIMAQQQQSSIEKDIKDLGLPNQVIVI